MFILYLSSISEDEAANLTKKIFVSDKTIILPGSANTWLALNMPVNILPKSTPCGLKTLKNDDH